MTIETMGTGLKTRLQTISAFRDVHAPNELPGTINALPCAVVLIEDVEYLMSFSNSIRVNFRVVVLVGKEDQQSRLNDIMDYAERSGAKSIYAAIEGDDTLGGTADFSVVKSNGGVGYTEWGAENFVSTEFRVECQEQ